MNPNQNMRDILKQVALLEDHLFHESKRCPDCIRKHFLTIEGLAEECGTLCAKRDRALSARAGDIASTVRVLHHAWERSRGSPAVSLRVADKLRVLRKSLMAQHAALPVDELPKHEAKHVKALASPR
jgi:hypothetical protein